MFEAACALWAYNSGQTSLQQCHVPPHVMPPVHLPDASVLVDARRIMASVHMLIMTNAALDLQRNINTSKSGRITSMHDPDYRPVLIDQAIHQYIISKRMLCDRTAFLCTSWDQLCSFVLTFARVYCSNWSSVAAGQPAACACISRLCTMLSAPARAQAA